MRRKIKRFVETSNQPQENIMGDINTEIKNKEGLLGTEENADGTPVKVVTTTA
jgi:hypothetical protein